MENFISYSVKMLLQASPLLVLFALGCKSFYIKNEFPEEFMFGVSSSGNQTEGARNQNEFESDSYDKFHQELEQLILLKVKFYQFSISWRKILPHNKHDHFNKTVVEHYLKIIKKLRENEIQPIIVMMDRDCPVEITENYSLANEKFAEYFRIYADILFSYLGKYVKYWITIYDLDSLCRIPDKEATHITREEGEEEYYCLLNLLTAHSKVYHLYHTVYRKFHGLIGVSISTKYYFPAVDNRQDADLIMDYTFGITAHPIFSEKGDWPKSVIDRNYLIYNNDRFSTMNPETAKKIKGTADFLALEYKTSLKVDSNDDIFSSATSNCLAEDMYVEFLTDQILDTSLCFHTKKQYSVPDGLENLLYHIESKYNNPKILILENNFCTKSSEEWNIIDRHTLLKEHLKTVLKAKKNGVNVLGYSTTRLFFMD